MPTVMKLAGWKVPSPLPSRTETLLPLPLLATTKSSLPSPFTSPMATDWGLKPTG